MRKLLDPLVPGAVSAVDATHNVLVISGNAVNATLYPNLNFSFLRDIAPVTFIGYTPFVLAANPSFRSSIGVIMSLDIELSVFIRVHPWPIFNHP